MLQPNLSCGYFIKLFLDKRYALPYRTLDVVLAHLFPCYPACFSFAPFAAPTKIFVTKSLTAAMSLMRMLSDRPDEPLRAGLWWCHVVPVTAALWQSEPLGPSNPVCSLAPAFFFLIS
jgi:hypothetical protein